MKYEAKASDHMKGMLERAMEARKKVACSANRKLLMW